jgi:hypothetical protein
MNLQKDQKPKKSDWGGAREGSGRKKHLGLGEQISKKMRRKFRDLVSEEDYIAVVESAVKQAKSGDTAMQRFLIEQIDGKATQRIAGDDEHGPVSIMGFNYILPDVTVEVENDIEYDSNTSTSEKTTRGLQDPQQ